MTPPQPPTVVTPLIDTVSDLLAHNRIPTLDAGQMSDFSRYLFTASNKTERIQVAEAVYRHDHDHPSALDVFLACTLPWLKSLRAVERTRFSFTPLIGKLN